MFVNVSSRDAGNSHHSSVKSDNNSLSYPSRTIVHPKLEMTEPGDADEQEADAAAHDVMSGKVFRKFSGGGAGGGMAVSSQMESQLNQLQGGGQRMPDGLRDMMERGFDRDFSQVRLHTDGEAVGLSSSIHAKAFTHGNDIYFNQGQYAPETSEGQRLVAHELAHVAQGGGKVGRTEEDNTAISVNDRVRRSEVMSNLRYCELRAESLIDDVKERKEMDSSLWGWLSNIGDDEFDADYLIDTLQMCRSKLRDLRKCKNSIDEISRGVNEILRVIRMVESALAARRNNSIEGANKWVSGLRYTRDACFTTVGIIASVAVPATAAAAVSLKVVNAGMNIVDTVEDAKSLYENVQSGNVLGAIVAGASVASDVVGFGGLKNAKNIGRGVDAAQSAGKGSKAVKDVKKADTVQSVGSGRNAAKDQGEKVDTATRGGSESKAAKGQGEKRGGSESKAAKDQGDIKQTGYNEHKLREEYTIRAQNIKDEGLKKINAGENAEEVARWANNERNRLKVEYLEKTPEDLRNLIFKYNIARGKTNKWGTMEYEAVKTKLKTKLKDKTDIEIAIEIIESAARPQPSAKEVANDIYKKLGDESLEVLNKYNMFE